MLDRPTTKAKKLVRSVHPMKAGRALGLVFSTLALIMIGVAAMWTYVAQQFLTTAVAAENEPYLERGRALFDVLRQRTQESLRGQCRVLVEDPRLKSALSTDGIDTATVTDILGDLARLRHAGMLVVLSTDGHVFAEANADELRGLDLSASNVVKNAQLSNDAVIGSWVIGGKIIDVSTMAIRFNATVIGYLVVGQAVDETLVKNAAEGAGVDLGLVLGNDVALGWPDNERTRTMLLSFAKDTPGGKPRIIEAGGDTYATAVSELDEGTQSHPRLAAARALAPTIQNVQTLRWLLWAAPVLVALAVLLSFMRPMTRPISRPGEPE
jgi:hypothetical protein